MPKPSEIPNEKDPLARFKMVTSASKSIRGMANRDPEGAKVSPTGLVEVNVAGTELIDSIAMAKRLDLNKYAILFGGDEETGQAAALVVEPNTPGAKPVRRNTASRTITLYMNDLFREQPRLRPTSERWCALSREPDGRDGHFIIIHLNVALERRSSTRRKAAEKPADKAAEKAAEKSAEKRSDKPAEKPKEGAAPAREDHIQE